MKTFKDIVAWQKGLELSIAIYKYTTAFPRGEEFGLKSELRRASISVISNIAEGFKKKSKKEALHFYNRSECSLEEIKAQTIVSKRLEYFSDSQHEKIMKLADDCGRTLSGWMKAQQNFVYLNSA